MIQKVQFDGHIYRRGVWIAPVVSPDGRMLIWGVASDGSVCVEACVPGDVKPEKVARRVRGLLNLLDRVEVEEEQQHLSLVP